jgi:GNAT superfamily N-acetyltransferase
VTTSDVSVRVAWPADAPGIADVQLRGWYGAGLAAELERRGLGPLDLADQWRQTIARPPEARYRALVALSYDRVVGFALTGPSNDPDADPATDGEVSDFVVDPEQTRGGHGSRLLQACADTLAADGFTRATWWVASTDDTLRAFLTEAGWAPDGAARELADPEHPDGGTATLKQVRLHTSLA